MKNIKKKSTENFHLLQLKTLCVLHGRVFVMNNFKSYTLLPNSKASNKCPSPSIENTLFIINDWALNRSFKVTPNSECGEI